MGRVFVESIDGVRYICSECNSDLFLLSDLKYLTIESHYGECHAVPSHLTINVHVLHQTNNGCLSINEEFAMYDNDVLYHSDTTHKSHVLVCNVCWSHLGWSNDHMYILVKNRTKL